MEGWRREWTERDAVSESEGRNLLPGRKISVCEQTRTTTG